MSHLSPDEVETYHRDGLVIPNYRLDAITLARLLEAFEDLLARNPGTDRNVIVCPHLSGYGPLPLVGNSVFLEVARNPEILDMVEQVMGPDILLWGTTIFGKPAGHGQIIPWHQDAPHWPIKPEATTSVWIALDPCTEENGCLRYIPGSHHAEAHHVNINDAPQGQEAAVRLILDSDTIDDHAARDVLLEPGQISIHDTWLVHSSKSNLSQHRRAAFVIRFMPASAFFDHTLGNEAAKRAGAVTDYADRPLYLMRGNNIGGSNLEIGHER